MADNFPARDTNESVGSDIELRPTFCANRPEGSVDICRDGKHSGICCPMYRRNRENDTREIVGYSSIGAPIGELCETQAEAVAATIAYYDGRGKAAAK